MHNPRVSNSGTTSSLAIQRCGVSFARSLKRRAMKRFMWAWGRCGGFSGNALPPTRSQKAGGISECSLSACAIP